jgi:hypothetical protein
MGEATKPALSLNEIGYFTEPGQTTPSYEPPFPCRCPVCGGTVDDSNARTVSCTPMNARLLSVFYRLHRQCADGLTPYEHAALDAQAMRLVGAGGEFGVGLRRGDGGAESTDALETGLDTEYEVRQYATQLEAELENLRAEVASLVSRLAEAEQERDDARTDATRHFEARARAERGLAIREGELLQAGESSRAERARIADLEAKLRAMTEERDRERSVTVELAERAAEVGTGYERDIAAARAERDEAVRMMQRYREAGAAIDSALSREAAGALVSPRAWIKVGDTAEPRIWFCSFCGEDYTTRPEAGFCTNTVNCRAAVRARVALDAWKARENVVERMNADPPPAEPGAAPPVKEGSCGGPPTGGER